MLTVGQAWELVDQADFLYESFKELSGTEPLGSGPLRIAFVDNCGAGCGYVGYKGVELQPYFASGGVWFARGDIPDLYGYMAHEMTHNFDRWSSYVMCGPDIAHAWTSFMDVYVVAANQQGATPNSNSGRGYSPAELLKKRVDEFFQPYLNAVGASWSTCVRDGTCTNINPVTTQGGFVARLAQIIGPAATRGALVELRDAATNRGLKPGTMTPEQKNDLLLECFSRGAQTNLACLVAPLNWTISHGMQSQLDALFGTNNAVCNDADGDGYTPLQGDLNDAQADIHPGAVEVVNGIDDDCSGVIDDILVVESVDFPDNLDSSLPVPFPARIAGSTSSGSDNDCFQITLGAATKVRWSLKSVSTFTGWVFVYNAAGGRLTYGHCGVGSQLDLDVSMPAGTWRFSVGYSTPGAYQLTCAAVLNDWPIYVYPRKPTRLATNQWQLASGAGPSTLLGASNLQARFWASSFGWIATNGMETSIVTAVNWTTPSNLPPADTTYRVQLYQSGLPAWRVTEALPLVGGFQLSIIPGASNVVQLNWSAVAPGLFLCSASSLAGNWEQVTNNIQFTNGCFRVSTTPDSKNLRVYRLEVKGKDGAHDNAGEHQE